MKIRKFRKNPWTREEDMKLTNYISRYKIWNWNQMPKYAGLSRSGKSCRLRWLNYLSPDIKRGNFTKDEDETIINMHQIMGTRWSVIASKLPGRTDNEIKNHWHTHLKKRSRCSINQISEESPNSSLSKSELVEHGSSIEVNNIKNFCTPQDSISENCDDAPIFSPHVCDILGESTSLNPDVEVDKAEGYNNKMDVVEPINGDPYISFWREPYSFGNFCVEDQDQCDIAGAFSDQAAFKPQGFMDEGNNFDDNYSNYNHCDWLNLIGSVGDYNDFF